MNVPQLPASAAVMTHSLLLCWCFVVRMLQTTCCCTSTMPPVTGCARCPAQASLSLTSRLLTLVSRSGAGKMATCVPSRTISSSPSHLTATTHGLHGRTHHTVHWNQRQRSRIPSQTHVVACGAGSLRGTGEAASPAAPALSIHIQEMVLSSGTGTPT